MADISSVTRFFNKCRVFHTPTTLSGDPPYGGTELGAVKNIHVYTGGAGRVFRDYYTGLAINSAKSRPSPPLIVMTFRQWTTDLLPLFFPAVTDSTIDIGGALGSSGIARSKKIVLASEDKSGLFALMQRAIPDEEEGAHFQWDLDEEHVLIGGFRPAAPATGSTPALQIGLASEITI